MEDSGEFKNHYVKSTWSSFTNKSDPDRAFFKVMFKLDDFVEEMKEFVADNGFVYLYIMADKESYNNRHKHKAIIKRPFIVPNQKAFRAANNKIRQKLYAIEKRKNDEEGAE
jgi:hypothetical protein